ncbi:hypothetical protein [Vulcanisaeta souniana]|uniref:hypothetical protein n=1 Tax=Vulcanisaeta souniana TaxID=164452 RepID=UPI001E5B2C76|nr:hypothetical protein [Vulcanisaeta souniana]
MINDDLSRLCGLCPRGSENSRDVSPVPLGSKESHDPPTVKLGRWLRAKSLHSIMNEHKMNEMKV